jgi:micrococcal nuclease
MSLYSWSHLNFTLEVAAMKSKVWFAVPVLVLLVLISHHANSETKPAPSVFTGKVVAIIDGDSAKVLRDKKTIEVRLVGIDAPEMDQPFGKQSKRFVSKLIFGKTVDVKDLGLDSFKRTLVYITQGSTPV